MSVDEMEMSEMDAWQDGLYLEVDTVNLEPCRKLKKGIWILGPCRNTG